MASRRELVGALRALMRSVLSNTDIRAVSGTSLWETCRLLIEDAEKGNAAPTPWTPLTRRDLAEVRPGTILAAARALSLSQAEVEAIIGAELADVECWANQTYQVILRHIGNGVVYLSVKRLDQEPIHDWRDLQRIKNQLLGPECEAVELYPAESRKIDIANQYHLWGVLDSAYRFPMGWTTRAVADDSGIDGTHQRPGAGK